MEATTRPRYRLQNDKVVVGLIGCGGMGKANTNNLLQKGVEVAALCDVDSRHLRSYAAEIDTKFGMKANTYSDYRRLLEQKNLNAVVIGTPDHWHALPFIAACEAGKDIYCEKPISHSIVEAKAMVAAAEKYKRVVQIGTWQRSTKDFVDAVEFVRGGGIGKITHVRAWKTDGFRMGRNAPKDPPSELDYDFWVGPAAMEPYRDHYTHFDWRWYFNFAAGMTGDWGVHMMDICLLGMAKDQDLPMPTEVAAYGGKLAWPDDDRTTPDTHVALMQFPGFVLHWETGRKGLDSGYLKANANGIPLPTLDHGSEFIAADGSSVVVWRGGWIVRGPDGAERPKPNLDPYKGSYDHWKNFLDCMRTRETPRSSIRSMAQTTIVCHLANVAYLAGGPVKWDKASMDLVGSAGKNTPAYSREYRRKTKSGDWKLTMHKA
jgi:predicted dehydrogenase